ncbi:MAG: archaeosortase A [Methanobacteriota archaeon]
MDTQKKSSQINDTTIVGVFFLIPTIMLLFGYFVFPYPQPEPTILVTYSLLFLGLLLLGIGYLKKDNITASKSKIAGWVLFSSFWATYPHHLYYSEGGDIFNAAVCIIGVYVLFYLAYQEWLSIQKKEYPASLNWIAGGTFLAGIIYFTIDIGVFPQLKTTLIEIVASHSTMVLNLFNLHATNQGSIIKYAGTTITIIFACTAIQSMVLFVGMIGALHTNMKKKNSLVSPSRSSRFICSTLSVTQGSSF